MTFARCLVGEPDPGAHYAPQSVQHRSSSTGSAVKNSKMPSLLGAWATRKNSNPTAPTSSKDNTNHRPATPPTESNNNDTNPQSDESSDPKTPTKPHQQQQQQQHHHRHHHHHHHHSKKTTTATGVTYRRGEKSFLDFHQNYAITRHLGEGSYSTVKQVTHRRRGGSFACKIVDKASLSSVDRVALGHEVRVLSTVQHENVMRLYEVIEDDAKCYLIMELAEQGDLFDKIVKQGRFPEHEAQRVVAALVEALYYCHSNAIIHRDVKPENVLLTSDANVKLCDFGFAKQLRDGDEQSTDSCGTPGYAAPEILDGKPYGVEVDVFSLGVVTYIMLCGYPPFPMKLAQLRTHRFNVRFPSKDWGAIDPVVKELITSMLSVKPDVRPKMSALRDHPWVQKGKARLDAMRAEAEERKRLELLQQKQVVADTIRKKLITTGFDVVKHGRQGQPHRTKLRLSTDGKVLSWQPKLLKRGLLRYQNAKSLTSLLGFGGGNNNSNNSNASPRGNKHKVEHPQIARLSSLPSERSTASTTATMRLSEPTATTTTTLGEDDDLERMAAAAATASASSQSGTLSTSGSSNNGSATWIDKKNWWRAFRRQNRNPSSNDDHQRSASGGFSFAAFSLASSTRSTRSSSSSCSSSSLSEANADSQLSPETGPRMSRSDSTDSMPSSPSASSALTASGSMSPKDLSPCPSPTASASSSSSSLDSSIHLRDIRLITLGEESAFFQARSGTNHTDTNHDETDDKHDETKQQQQKKTKQVDPSCALTVTTRFRELHLEFTAEDLRDAFAYLLEQATLPLEDVAPPPQAFLYRKDQQTSDTDDDNNKHR